MSLTLLESLPATESAVKPDSALAFANSAETELSVSVQTAQDSEDVSGSLAEITGLTKSMGHRLGKAVKEIDEINLQTRLLSFNAQVEASRAGNAGRAFGVVAKEMVDLAARTAGAASKLDRETRTDIRQLSGLVDNIGIKIRGTRLSDLAFTNIDLIDRNLYERSCDVRWWATDASCVRALESPEEADQAQARLGLILDSYTVYFDIVLCDLQGKVVTNGRPKKYATVGTDQSAAPWFRAALATRSGEEFGFQGCHHSPTLAGRQMILVYSCVVRTKGDPNGEPLGVLGIVFNWEALAQTIMLRTQIGESEKSFTRVCIVDQHELIIADNKLRHLHDQLPLADKAELIAQRKGYIIALFENEPHLIAYSQSPGFETYATGWHSFIIQKVICQ